MRPIFYVVVFFFSACLVQAEEAMYPFETEDQARRFQQLTEVLRCPKCQNQNLADSASPIARDLKKLVHEKIRAGDSDEEIIQYLKDRYGDFVIYEPPKQLSTWWLWYGPFLLIPLIWIGPKLLSGGKPK